MAPLSLWAFPEAAVMNKTSPAAAVQVPFGAIPPQPYKSSAGKLTPGMPAPPDEGSLCSPYGRRARVAGARGGRDAAPPRRDLLSSCVWQALSPLRHLSVPTISLHERVFPSVWTAHFGHAPPSFIMVAEAYLRCHFAQRWKSAIMFL